MKLLGIWSSPQIRMSGRDRSGTYSSLCEDEEDFIPPVRSHSINDITDFKEIELGNALLRGKKDESAQKPIQPQDTILYGSLFRF